MSRRFIAPDSGVKQVAIEGMRTGSTQIVSRDKAGFFEARTAAQVKALKAEGFVEASLMGAAQRSSGFICSDCGFNAWFKQCGRCGGECKRAE